MWPSALIVILVFRTPLVHSSGLTGPIHAQFIWCPILVRYGVQSQALLKLQSITLYVCSWPQCGDDKLARNLSHVTIYKEWIHLCLSVGHDLSSTIRFVSIEHWILELCCNSLSRNALFRCALVQVVVLWVTYMQTFVPGMAKPVFVVSYFMVLGTRSASQDGATMGSNYGASKRPLCIYRLEIFSRRQAIVLCVFVCFAAAVHYTNDSSS